MTEANYEPTSLYGYEGIEGKGAVLATTLNQDSLLSELDRKLAGEILKETKEGVIEKKKVGKELMNEDGRAAIILKIMMYANKDIKLSNIDKNEQEKIMGGIITDTNYMLAHHQEEWEIDFVDLDEISHLIAFYAFLSLSRAVGARELDHVYTTTRRETLTQKQDQKSTLSQEGGGFLSGFRGKKEDGRRYE